MTDFEETYEWLDGWPRDKDGNPYWATWRGERTGRQVGAIKVIYDATDVSIMPPDAAKLSINTECEVVAGVPGLSHEDGNPGILIVGVKAETGRRVVTSISLRSLLNTVDGLVSHYGDPRKK